MGGLGAPWSQREACTHRSLGYPTARQTLAWALVTGLLVACGGPEDASLDEAALAPEAGETASESQELFGWPWPPAPKPVGLALEVDNGKGQLLRVRAGSSFYINQIDLRASVLSNRDTGLAALKTQSDFAGLGWSGLKAVDEEPVLLGSPGAFTRRRFYRGAAWMDVPSIFTVEPVDSRGRLTGLPVVLNIGSEDSRRERTDDFFIRRLRAIQSITDCQSPTNCTGARKFEEEALVEVRNAYEHAKAKAFTLTTTTTALRLRWSLRPFTPYIIPVEQVRDADYAYGFGIDVKALTPPRRDGTYAPGSEITFQVALKDGAGNRLHPEGSLPSYNEVAPDGNAAGIQYYRAFFDATTTYYRRKHRERMLMSQIIGPAQNIQPIRSVIALEAFLDPEVDEQVVATEARDGVYSQFAILPFANIVFRGAFFPEEGLWDRPNTDKWQYKIPADATPGTYLVTVKGRRVYLGEDLPGSRTIEIQVGTPRRTEARLTTGPCNSCHSEGGELSQVLHGNDNRAACSGCHAPLGFELEGPIFVRTHFIHSRSNRFDKPLEQCSSCHLTKESIQRTSKAACLSCHKSYPKSHEAQFGKIESMYVGGGPESFQQCTGACHTQHPRSGL
ncbi:MULTISPECIES: cytochrome C [unclassified Myxococcus]|uniref:cytochrome C n=1 Tax=Myxococcus TaxID=32 RepID=UPI001CC05D06|nr:MULTISPECIES: cytochrome C [unclassified Myxococcus]MBZ4395761.1 cytochrome C [Myxococcus sp. AS-1-15]MBZ4411377.1 cytochrome C [Myxococcus sp. XM-1-1-1]BDT31121.1 cytochrome C [Myxococcus sp. MH1]